MSRPIRRATCVVGALAAIVLAGCGGGSSAIPSNAVVSIGGKAITRETFTHWMAVADAGRPVPVPPDYTACIAGAVPVGKAAKAKTAPSQAQLKASCEQQYKQLQQEVLGFLISATWTVGQAEERGVRVSDGEVTKKFETLNHQLYPKPGEFRKYLATSHESVSDFLLRLKLNLVGERLQKAVVREEAKVTQAESKDYYNANRKQFDVGERRAARIILTKTEAQARAAEKEIEAGQSFAVVAKRVSGDPSAKKGGELGVVSPGQEPGALDPAIFTAKTKVLSGPVKTPTGYYLLEVQSIVPGSQETFKQAEASIKPTLAAKHNEAAKSAIIKKWTAMTDCSVGYVVADCKQYKAPAGQAKE